MAGTSKVRAHTVHGQGVTEVTFRRPRWWMGLLGLLGFAAAWLAGLMFAVVLLAVAGSNQLMLAIWIIVWVGIGLLVLTGLLWRALGVEVLVARPDSLTLIRRLLFLKAPVVLPAADIVSIEWLADDPTRKVTVNGRRIPQPAIGIAAQDRTLHCASGIAEAEARDAIAGIERRLAVARRRR